MTLRCIVWAPHFENRNTYHNTLAVLHYTHNICYGSTKHHNTQKQQTKRIKQNNTQQTEEIVSPCLISSFAFKNVMTYESSGTKFLISVTISVSDAPYIPIPLHYFCFALSLIFLVSEKKKGGEVNVKAPIACLPVFYTFNKAF